MQGLDEPGATRFECAVGLVERRLQDGADRRIAFEYGAQLGDDRADVLATDELADVVRGRAQRGQGALHFPREVRHLVEGDLELARDLDAGTLEVEQGHVDRGEVLLAE